MIDQRNVCKSLISFPSIPTCGGEALEDKHWPHNEVFSTPLFWNTLPQTPRCHLWYLQSSPTVDKPEPNVRKWQPTPVFLPGESQEWGSLVGCRLCGRTESDTTEVT